MVKLKKQTYHNEHGVLDTELWLEALSLRYPAENLTRLRLAIDLAAELGRSIASISAKESALSLGLHMAELLAELSADESTLIAALLYPLVLYSDFTLDDVRQTAGLEVSTLVAGALRMDEISDLLHADTSKKDSQLSRAHNLRKMLLAMAKDIRVVILKISEKISYLRVATDLDVKFQQRIATEVKEIYAPLSNRLGLGHLKWEMEDWVFRYLDPKEYQALAKALDQKRVEREDYIAGFQKDLEALLRPLNLKACEISGRAKHLYSIYKKMNRKKVGLEKIYDSFAVRVLVSDLDECYKVLSVVHTQWSPIAEEFDDYIAKPKGNGYQSLHTAVVGPAFKNVEVQIRTFEMHEVSELGVAAHWKYKEGPGLKQDQTDKVAWLRQLLSWQSEYTSIDPSAERYQTAALFEDSVFVFTPEGDIIDLKKGATPLDFAYHVHSEVGHRCKGAKINGKIVPLVYTLNTGDRVEIITGKIAHPSLDWLDPKAGFISSSKARAKISQWFKSQNYEENLAEGQALLNEAAKREHLELPPLLPIALALHFKNIPDLLAALGGGHLKLAQILGRVQAQTSASEYSPKPHALDPNSKTASDISVYGLNDILHSIAQCCKPIPGDPITGFITRQRGISVHHQACHTLQNLHPKERVIAVDWRDVSTLYRTKKLN